MVGSLLCLLVSWVLHCRLYPPIHPVCTEFSIGWPAPITMLGCLPTVYPGCFPICNCLQLLLFASPCYKLCVLYSVAGHGLCSHLVHFLGQYFKGQVSKNFITISKFQVQVTMRKKETSMQECVTSKYVREILSCPVQCEKETVQLGYQPGCIP